MAVDQMGSGSTGSLDLNSLLQSALLGGNMTGILGSNNEGLGSGVVLGLLLGRLGILGNGMGMDGLNPAQPQANMSIMSGIGDIKQAVAVAEANMVANNSNQTGVIQNQVSGVAAALTNTVTQAKDAAAANSVMLMQQLNSVNTNLMETKFALAEAINNDGDKTRALIQSIETANLNRQLTVAQNEVIELRNESRIQDSGINVTNNINQNNQMQQQQQQLVALTGAIQTLIPYIQNVGQSVVNLGTMSGSAGSQTAANTRVNA